jgi:hypothetical protein
VGGEVDKLRNARSKAVPSNGKERQECYVGSDKDDGNLPGIEKMINEKTDNDKVYHDCGSDITITETNAGKTFGSAVIFGHCLQDNAPPEIAVDQEIPVLPAGIDGVAPAF